MLPIQNNRLMQFTTVRFALPIAAVATLLVIVNLCSDVSQQGRQAPGVPLPIFGPQTEKSVEHVIQRGTAAAEKLSPIITRPIDIGFDYIEKASDSLQRMPTPTM